MVFIQETRFTRGGGTNRKGAAGSGSSASQQFAGKRKASELASSGDSMEPANRRPAPGAGSLPLPATPAVTGE